MLYELFPRLIRALGVILQSIDEVMCFLVVVYVMDGDDKFARFCIDKSSALFGNIFGTVVFVAVCKILDYNLNLYFLDFFRSTGASYMDRLSSLILLFVVERSKTNSKNFPLFGHVPWFQEVIVFRREGFLRRNLYLWRHQKLL